MNEIKANKKDQKPKKSKLAIASLIISLTGLVLLLKNYFFAVGVRLYPSPPPSCPKITEYILPFTCLVIAIFLGLVSLFKIKKSKRKLIGNKLANKSIIVSCLLLSILIFVYWCKYKNYWNHIYHIGVFNLRTLRAAMLLYADDYDDQYPQADKWCDLLIKGGYVFPEYFVCNYIDTKIGESNYAFNKYLIDKKTSEVYPRTVLLFETDYGKNPAGRQSVLENREWYRVLSSRPDSISIGWDFNDFKARYHSEKVYKLRWNQVGGAEIVTFDNHYGKGCNVLFNDGTLKFIRAKDISKLKWKTEDSDGQ